MAMEPPTTERTDLRAGRTVDLIPFRPIYEYPLGVDPKDGRIVPQLATSWSIEPDGTSIRFQLRKGVPFHFGKGEFTSQDIFDNWRLRVEFDPSVPSSNTPLFTAVVGVDKISPNETVVHLKTPDGTFLTSNFTESRGVFEIFSGQHFKELGTPTMDTGPVAGSGPYQFKTRGQGTFIRYEKVPYQHWRVTPDFPEFEFRFMKEASTRMASLLAGEAHLADLPEDLKAQALKQGFKAMPSTVPANQVFMSFNCCHYKDPKNPAAGVYMPESPLMDLRVRKALSKSIDRDQINKTFFSGHGLPLYLLDFDATRPGWNPDWQKNFQSAYGYDPEAAKALLAEAGYNAGNPLTVNAIYPAETRGGFSGDDIQDTIGAMWRKIGVNVQPQNVDPSQVTAQRNVYKLENHLSLGNTASDQWTVATTMGSTISSGTRGRQPDNLAADNYLTLVSSTLDEKKADEYWRGVGNEHYNGYRSAPLFTLPIESVADPKVVGSWVYPGTLTGYWSHVFDIKAAK